MTTRTRAEALLFEKPLLNKGSPATPGDNDDCTTPPELMATSPSPTRSRLKPIYCPRCAGWVEVHLQPVRLRCVGCGLEARP